MKKNLTALEVLYEEPGPKTKARIKIATILSSVILAALVLFIIWKFYVNEQLTARYWDFFATWPVWRFILKGLFGTIKVTLTAVCITFVLGFIMMYGRVRGVKAVKILSNCFINFFRGVPTLLLIYFFFFGLPSLGIKISAFWKITIPCALSASGPVAEVLRSGINSVNKGQREAALSLGFSERRTFFKILFPQGFKYVVPSLIAQLVIILKDTTFAYIVSYNDLMQNASVLISNHDAMLSVYLVVSVIYILINYFLNKLSVFLANKNAGNLIKRAKK